MPSLYTACLPYSTLQDGLPAPFPVLSHLDATSTPSQLMTGMDDLLKKGNKNFERSFRFIATRRDNVYREVSFHRFIPLAFYAAPTVLRCSRNIDSIVQDIGQLYENDQCNLFEDWQRYCKALYTPLLELALYGIQLFFLALI